MRWAQLIYVAPFFIYLITFDLDKIPLLPQIRQMTLCGSGYVPKDSFQLQVHAGLSTCPPGLA